MRLYLAPLFRVAIAAALLPTFAVAQSGLQLSEKEYFETQGLNVLVFSNWYDGLFSDSKISGIELIHHGVRTATNGDVRLNRTPEQWDTIPTFIERTVDASNQVIEARLGYPDFGFEYTVRGRANDDGSVTLTIHSEEPLPDALEGRAGFNLEFLPSAYWGKSYVLDETLGSFPLYPRGLMSFDFDGNTQPEPLATGRELALAPEDDERRVVITSEEQPLELYDGRNKAQNGWFVVRSLLPSDTTGTLLEWRLEANAIPGWTRPPMIAHSQVGYHPQQEKVAIIELDRNDTASRSAALERVHPDGRIEAVHAATPESWGDYLRYRYAKFDFSDVREQGIYRIRYGDQTTTAFRIGEEVFDGIWHPSLDIYLPVQMDHVLVNEAYRVWHGASHLDDARQAPVDHVHFDLYAQGPTTDSPFAPGEHIPGLNIGGWYDAGDYDIRTQTQYYTVIHLTHAWEDFQLTRDNTLVNQEAKYVDLHHPDGVADIQQQIEHGALGLVAQFRTIGHAIPGIIVPDISQYTHLGDGLTMTDNLVYDPEMGQLESDGIRSGVPDDRWAFTSKSTPLNYGAAAGLAAASRALRGYNEALAAECLATALKVWELELGKEPDLFRHGNTTGGRLEEEELKAAAELLLATQQPHFAQRMEELWPEVEARFAFNVGPYARALPYLSDDFKGTLREAVAEVQEGGAALAQANPFGVPITEGGWAGSGAVVGYGISNYLLHKAFPDLVDPEPTYRALQYLLGTHPAHNLSLVSAVGAKSKDVAYGMNRADFSFIAGGVVPGILILKPDYPENKNDWPFLWGENEYVINVASSYIYLANAVQDLLGEQAPDDE